jgi:mevalonate kinase
MDALRPQVHGIGLAGAGGGGFMIAVSREPHARAAMQATVSAMGDVPADVVFHEVAIDPLGLCVRVEDARTA